MVDISIFNPMRSASQAPAGQCGLTVLRTVGDALATKKRTWNDHLKQWLKIDYQAGAQFIPTEHSVASIAELATLLEVLRLDPSAFVVRGALTPETAAAVAANPRHRIRRRKHAKGDALPALAEVPRRWIMVDIDNWPLRSSDDLAADPADAIEHAIYELLPAAFHDAACWWQLSASAGFTPGLLKAHLWFWLSEPATSEHVKAVFKQHAPGIDRAPFNAVQIHYIADPIIEGGYDPLPLRTGLRQGLDDAVTLPALVSTPRQPGQSSSSSSAGLPGGVIEALAFMGDGDGLEGFHAPLLTATMRYAKRCARYGGRDDAAAKAQLRAAIRAAPKAPGRDVEAIYCTDAYLDRLISGAFALLAGDAEIQTMRPHHQAATDTIEDARAALALHVTGFLARALRWNALDEAARIATPGEHAALVVGVGTGKTTVSLAGLPAFIKASKAAGQPHRILWLVPTHKLGNETLAKMRQLGISAAVMRGREAEVPGTADPDNYKEAQKMCLNLDAVEDALAIHTKIESGVCGSGQVGKPCCPWRIGPDQCAFQRQKNRVASADVVIAAHQSMFFELAKELRSELAAVIVDESWWQAGLMPNRTVHLDSFAQEPVTHPVLDKHGKPDNFGTADLHEFSRKAQRAFEATPDQAFVSKAAVTAAGLTIIECVQAYALEWRRMVEGMIYPGQTTNDRRKLLGLAAGNGVIPRRAAIWKALQELLESDATHTGRLQMGTKSTPDGTLRTIILHSRLTVRAELAGLPMLHMDAAMPLDLVRHYLPRIELLAEVTPTAPHMRVHQVIGGWGKTSLIQHDKATEDENRRRGGLVRELADFAGLNSGGNAAVITYKDIEPTFERSGIRTGHFNAIAGLDTFKDVRSLFVIGRPLPDARDLHAMALALTGQAIGAEQGRVETRGVLMADGTGAALNARVYADPDLEALRVAITDAAIIQAIGRCRAVNRTAADPVDVFLFADVVVPLPITRLVRWVDVRPSIIERMASRGAVLTSATDAARAYPDLFEEGAEAARKAIGRQEVSTGHSPMNSISIGECPVDRWLEVTYRPDAPRMKRRRALIPASDLVTFGARMTELLDVPVQVEHVPTPQPVTEKEPVMEQAEAPLPDLAPAQEDVLAELFRRMAAPWPTRECAYWAMDTSELTKAERWELLPLPPPTCQAVPAPVA